MRDGGVTRWRVFECPRLAIVECPYYYIRSIDRKRAQSLQSGALRIATVGETRCGWRGPARRELCAIAPPLPRDLSGCALTRGFAFAKLLGDRHPRNYIPCICPVRDVPAHTPASIVAKRCSVLKARTASTSESIVSIEQASAYSTCTRLRGRWKHRP